MANILKQTLNSNGYSKNSPLKEITVTLDSSITPLDVNSILVNNGTKYSKDMEFIPSGSTATILTPTEMFVCVFIAETGVLCPSNNNLEGEWKVISQLPFA